MYIINYKLINLFNSYYVCLFNNVWKNYFNKALKKVRNVRTLQIVCVISNNLIIIYIIPKKVNLILNYLFDKFNFNTLIFSQADPTLSSKDRKLSELRIWPSFMEMPLPNPPSILVVFSAVVLSTDSVFWYLIRQKKTRLVSKPVRTIDR